MWIEPSLSTSSINLYKWCAKLAFSRPDLPVRSEVKLMGIFKKNVAFNKHSLQVNLFGACILNDSDSPAANVWWMPYSQLYEYPFSEGNTNSRVMFRDFLKIEFFCPFQYVPFSLFFTSHFFKASMLVCLFKKLQSALLYIYFYFGS